MAEQLKIGDYNTLTISKVVDFGIYLNTRDADWGEVLLPQRYVPKDCQIGDELTVFIYFDSEDRLIATTEQPIAKVGEFAFLRALDVNAAGAFLDWGLPKDILVPYAEQSNRMRSGLFYLVYLYQDPESLRITASAKLSKFLDKTPKPYKEGDKVSGLLMAQTEIGYKVILEHQYTGMLYNNEVFSALKIGQPLTVIIKKIRTDGKLDLLLEQADKKDLSALEETIMKYLSANQGVLNIGDKTPPSVIYQRFGVSKKNFKRAISRLYKNRLIVIKDQQIYLPTLDKVAIDSK